jgi:cytochrome P450
VTLPTPVPLPTVRDRLFDPPAELGRLRQTSPVHPLRYPDGHLGWLVTSYQLAREALADRRCSARSELKRVPVARPGADPFIGAPALPGWLVDMDPPAHTRIRRALAGQFSARRSQALRPRIEQIVGEHLDGMAEVGPPADLVQAFALPVPSLTICELLGVPYTARAEFQRNSATLFSLKASAAEASEAMSFLDGFLQELIGHRSRVPGGDLLSHLVHGSDLSTAEIAGAGVLLLTAGHETTASSISLGTLALLCHPRLPGLIRDDPSLADAAVEELLRYLTIFHFGVPRSPLADLELGGRLIRTGETITISLPAANRDPDRFERPDELWLDRPAIPHLAFGHGRHQCLGQHLARAEMRAAFPALLRRFPGLRLDVPVDQVAVATDMGFYGVHHLPVAW